MLWLQSYSPWNIIKYPNKIKRNCKNWVNVAIFQSVLIFIYNNNREKNRNICHTVTCKKMRISYFWLSSYRPWNMPQNPFLEVFSRGYLCKYLENENLLDSLLIQTISHFNVRLFPSRVNLNKLINYWIISLLYWKWVILIFKKISTKHVLCETK